MTTLQPYSEALRETLISPLPDIKYDDLSKILHNAGQHVEIDFSDYQRTWLVRNIRKRLSRLHLSDALDYVDYLDCHPAEKLAFCGELWNNFTEFFRDRTVWDTLRQEVFPQMLARTDGNRSLRIWCAACSTGQEAYSLAILLAEQVGLSELKNRAEIIATDIDWDALGQAEEGVYQDRLMPGVPDDLREKYFIRVRSGWQICPEIRAAIRFRPHNLLGEFPKKQYDLILCRNLLIYLRPEAQRRVLASMKHCLADNGSLLLGRTETTLHHDLRRPFPECFNILNRQIHLYGAK